MFLKSGEQKCSISKNKKKNAKLFKEESEREITSYVYKIENNLCNL